MKPCITGTRMMIKHLDNYSNSNLNFSLIKKGDTYILDDCMYYLHLLFVLN